MTDERCPICGHPVKVVGSNEGTQHYEPVEDPLNPAALDLVRALSHLIGGAEGVMLDPLNTDWDRDKFEAGLAHARKAKAEFLAAMVEKVPR